MDGFIWIFCHVSSTAYQQISIQQALENGHQLFANLMYVMSYDHCEDLVSLLFPKALSQKHQYDSPGGHCACLGLL